MSKDGNAADGHGGASEGETNDPLDLIHHTPPRPERSNELSVAALEYAARGWQVFPVHGVVRGRCTCGRSPCDAAGKHPQTNHGYTEATTNVETIRQWWRHSPRANIGIATGSVSGMVVLDVDPDKGGADSLAELERQYGKLPATVEQITGGAGRHILFTHPSYDVRNRVRFAPGLDVRGDGGYIVAAPSMHISGRKYEWEISSGPTEVPLVAVPPWLLKAIATTNDGPGERVDTATALAGVPLGSRDESLFRLACKLRRADVPRDIAERLILDAASNCTPPFPPDEAVAKVESAYGRYQPAPDPTRDPYRRSQVGQPLSLVGLSELRTQYDGAVNWIVEGYLARGELAFIAGAGESLKSWAAAHLAAAIAGTFRWLGAFEVCAERVLFVEQERAANLVYQLNRIETAERVKMSDERLQVVKPTALPLSEQEARDALEDAIASFRPEIVIINALRDVLGRANENSPTDMAVILGALGRMAEKYGCCIIVIDHFNKAGLVGAVRGNAAHGGTAQKHSEADVVLVSERPVIRWARRTAPQRFLPRSVAPASQANPSL